MDSFAKRFSLLYILVFSITSHAAPVVFTYSTAFNTAVSGYTKSTLNFDSSVAGSLIADGGALGGITFSYPTIASFGVSMQTRDDFLAYSGANYLGTDDGGAFLSGDVFNLSFSSAHAVGMFFLTGDALSDGDISLTVGTTVASLSSAYETTLTDGSYVYFLGLLDATNTFNNVDVASLNGGFFEFNVDDITTATTQSNPVPAPPVLALLLVGLLPMLCKRKIKS